MLPLGLILLSLCAAGAVAFGCDPALVEWWGDVAPARWAHRLEWATVGLTVIAAMALVGLVITGRRRAWWLLGLLPVLGLFGWRFGAAPGQDRLGYVDDQPAFVSPGRAGAVLPGDDERVIGVLADGQAYALPLGAMRRTPVVVLALRDQRVLVAWSGRAGVASAATVTRAVRGRDLRIVTSAHGVLLLCNRRLGEFFDALTLRQHGPAGPGRPFTGFTARLDPQVMSWSRWLEQEPGTLLLDPRWPTRADADAPAPAPPDGDDAVVFVATEPPIVVPATEVGTDPANATAGNGSAAALLLREPGFGPVRAFDRRIDGDLYLRFTRNTDRSRRGVALVDEDTGSGWTLAGECVDGPLKGTRLRRLVVIENLPAATARFWVRP